jgi:hypothetical protein
MSSRFLIISSFLFLTGCASYDYRITEPANVAREIGTKSDEIFSIAPVEYRLRTVDSRLVMRIYNSSDAPITLLGERSTAVDPGGQSHPLETQTIAPNSFIKLILPPIRPRLEPSGPSIGIGFGTVIGTRPTKHGVGVYRKEIYVPRYMRVYDNQAIYWDWNGESVVHLNLVYQVGAENFEQRFVVARFKK